MALNLVSFMCTDPSMDGFAHSLFAGFGIAVGWLTVCLLFNTPCYAARLTVLCSGAVPEPHQHQVLMAESC